MALDLGVLNAIIDADDRGFNRAIDNVHKKLDGTASRMSVIGKMTVFATLATGAAGAASAIGPLIGLVGTLGTAIVGLGVAIPAFAASGAAVIGTLTLAFQGLGDAIAGDEEALERLAGPAREFVAVIEDLKPAWEDVQQAVQGSFFEGLVGIFDRAARSILPRLETGLAAVADGLSEMAAAALDAADSPRFLAGMTDVLDATAEGLRIAAEGVGGFVRGIGTLMSTAAPLIERMGLGFASLGDRFEDWIEQASASGELEALLDSMVDTLSTLGGIVTNVGSIFASVFGAANEQSGGLLNVIEDLTGRLAEFLASTEGQEGLQTFFAALSDVADAVIPIVLALASAFATELAPKIAEIAQNIGPSLEVVADNIGEALSRIDVDTVASALGDFLETASLLLIPLGELVGFLFDMSPVLLPLAGAIGVLVGALRAWQAIVVIATIVQWAWNAALLANPITWIVLLIVALIAVIVAMIVYWDEWTATVAASWEIVKSAIGDAASWIGDRLAAMWDWIVSKFEQGKTMLSLIWQSIVGYIEDRVNQAQAIFAWFGTLPGKIGDWFQGAYDAAKDKLSDLVDWVKGLPGRITSALGNLGDLLWDAGKDILQGLLDGIESMWSSVESKLSDLTGMIPDWKGPEETDKKLLVKPGQWIIGGLIDGLDSMIPEVQRTLQGLTTDIGLQVDAAAAPIAASAAPAVMELSAADRALLTRSQATQQTINVYDASPDPGVLAAEIDWRSRRRP